MTKLSDTQVIILSAAAQRADGNLLPLPGSLRGGAAAKVVGALLARGLAREEVTDRADPRRQRAQHHLAQRGRRPRGPAPDHRRRARGDRRRTAEAGRTTRRLPVKPAPIGRRAGGGAEAEAPVEAPKKRGRPKKAGARPAGRTAAPRKTRDDTKQAQLIAMLRRKEGATIAQIVAATGWQPHTVRGAFAGALKKKLGLTVTSEKVEGGERVYRID